MTARSPLPKPRSAGWHCLRVCEQKTWRFHGVRHVERSRRKNTSWSPLSHALHSLVTAAIIRVLKPIQNQRGNRGPVIGEDMKLPAQTSVAGARVGFVWLWNLGVLCINTHMYINPHSPTHPYTSPSHPPTPLTSLKKKNLHVPSAVSIWAVRRHKEPNRCFVGCRKHFGFSYFPLQFTPKKWIITKNHAMNAKEKRPSLYFTWWKEKTFLLSLCKSFCNGWRWWRQLLHMLQNSF